MNPLEHLKLIKENPGVYNFIPDEVLADILLQLVETKSLFKKAKLEIKNGVDGKDGVSPVSGVDFLSREQQEALISELVAKITIPQAESGSDGVDGLDAEISPEDIQFIVDTVYSAVFPLIPDAMTSDEIRNRLEVLTGDDRLAKESIRGIEEIEKAIEEIKNTPVDNGNGGLGRRQVTDLINTAIGALDTDSTPEFEKVNKNLSSYNGAFAYSGDDISTITYTTAGGTIVKTFNYTGTNITSIVLTGDLPVGLTETTKTFTYSGDDITNIAYT